MIIAYICDGIYPFTKGGRETRIYEISRRLVRRGHEVHIFGIRWWKSYKESEREGVILHGVCKPVFPRFVGDRRSISQALHFAYKVFAPLCREKFDIIDCDEYPFLHCFMVKAASIIRYTPMILTCHELWWDYWYEYVGRFGFFGKFIEKTVRGLPNKIIVHNNYMRNALISLDIPEAKIEVLRSGIDYSMIQKVKPSNEEIDVIFVGRLIKAKGVDFLIRSTVLVVEDYPGVRVGIVGDGPEMENLIKLAKELKVDKNITFYGRMEKYEDVLSLMKSSKVYVYPVAPEGGWSIAMLEANACGVPTITIKAGTLGLSSDLIEDGSNGFLVNGNFPELLGKKISLLLADERLRKIMGEKAREFARQLDWEKATDLIENIYWKTLS